MAPLPAGEPGLHLARDGAGARSSRLIAVGLAALAGLLAISLAHNAGVVGRAAVPPLARAAIATVALFAVGGFGLTRLLLPAALRRDEALWVLPVGACAVALTMTVLGFAAVPFHLNLALTLAGGAALGVVAWRRSPGLPDRPALARAAWPLWLAVLLAAVALVPLFRAGFATVEGQGQDAHLAVGTAQFLQHHYPTSIAPEEPVDRVPLVWRSKQPIYYVLGAAASLSGLEPFQTISTVAAAMLALAALGFFLLARELLRAPPWVALCAMAVVGLDRMVLHTVMHPYFNQTWGFFTLPFALVLSWWAVRERRTRGSVALLALVLAVGAFAYPLALPIPLVALAVLLWPERRALSPRRLYRGRRSLLWIVPLGLALVVPVLGVIEKAASAAHVIVAVNEPLNAWGGDLHGYFIEPRFLALNTWVALAAAAPFLLYGLWAALRALPRELRLALGAVIAFGVVFAVYFRLRPIGYYFHFKTLAFVAPLTLAVAVVGLQRAKLVVACLVALALSAANAEIGQTFDELPKAVLQLREIDAALPPGQSIRLDVDPQEQNWVAYMLHGQPLCSQHPLLGTSYPHVPVSRKADWILAPKSAARPRDAAPGPPAQTLDAWALYRARPDLPGRDACSQTMVQTVERITT